MPTALFFLPCERPLLDLLSGELSVISILDSVQPAPFQPPDDAPPQFSDARFVLPPFFAVVTWMRHEGDEGEWEQYVTLTAPDGRETRLTDDSRFSFNAIHHRVFQMTNVLTGRLFGVSTLSLKLRQVGTDEWRTVLTYPLNIEEFPSLPEETQPREES